MKNKSTNEKPQDFQKFLEFLNLNNESHYEVCSHRDNNLKDYLPIPATGEYHQLFDS